MVTAILLTSCVRMGKPDDVLLVTSDAVSVFATKQQSIAPSLGDRLAVLEPNARVQVLDCLDEGGYSIYKIRLSDGRTGFVNDGDFTLTNSNYSDSVWCGSKPRNPQWQRGWVTDCAGPEFHKFALDGAAGRAPERPVFRINPQLIVAIPKKYWPNAGSLGHEPRTCTKLRDLPTAPYLYFYLQGNWSSGYNPSDVPTVGGSAGAPPIRPDMVVVRIDREPPQSKQSAEEGQAIEEIRRKAMQEESKSAREIAGLRCADDWCSGPKGPDMVSLRYWQRSASFVEIQASYNSARYGGLSVWWKSFTSDISHWRDIDDEVWKLVAEWNLLDTAEGAAGRHTNGRPAGPTEAPRSSGAEAE
jgi:hypothetical protein